MKIRKFAWAVLLAAPLALPAAAWRVDAGYSTVALGTYREEMGKFVDQIKANGLTVEANNEPSGGVFVTTGLDFNVASEFTAGLEVGYYLLGKSAVKANKDTGSPGEIIRYDIEREFSLLPLGLRLGFLRSPGEGLYYGVNVGLGMGFGMMNGTINYSPVGGQDIGYSASFRGQGFVGDIHARAGKEWERFRLGGGLGYRLASFNEFNSTTTVPSPGGSGTLVREGDTLKNSKGDALPVDLSGLNLNLEFGVKF